MSALPTDKIPAYNLRKTILYQYRYYVLNRRGDSQGNSLHQNQTGRVDVLSKFFQLAFMALLLDAPDAFSDGLLTSDESQTSATALAPNGLTIRVFLIVVEDGGIRGTKVGCDDSVVAITREIPATKGPLKAAVEELMQLPPLHGSRPEFYNAWHQPGLKLKSASVRNAVARLSFVGPLISKGICDAPRIQAQIEATAKQFASVKKVKVFINGASLSDYLRESD